MLALPANPAKKKRRSSKAAALKIGGFYDFQKQFPRLATSPATPRPVVRNLHTCLDLMVWFQQRQPTTVQETANPNSTCHALISQKKKTPCWTWSEVKNGEQRVNLIPGNFYIANTLHIENRDPEHWAKPAKGQEKPRDKFKGSCIRNNKTRAFPQGTEFVFADLETYDAGTRCKPTFLERAALVEYCRERGALACGFSPSGIHPVLRFDRLVCVADPDPNREMESAVRWFFRDFPLRRWKLDIVSWHRSRLERACPLIYWDPDAVVKLPPVYPPLPVRTSDARGKSGKPRATKNRGDAVNFFGRPFFGSSAIERAIESNICLCRLAKMSAHETAKLTDKPVAHVLKTWAQLTFPDLSDQHGAAIRSKIMRNGKPLRADSRPRGTKPNGLPASWLDAPAQWFNPGKGYVTTASSYKFKKSGDFFAHSCGHSFQMFGDAGYNAEQAHLIILYWMALLDNGWRPHQAMQIASGWVNDTLEVSQEVRERSNRCLNWKFSWALSRLFKDLRKDFVSRDHFLGFLEIELSALAAKFWGKKRQLRPISHVALTFIERGVIRLIWDTKARLHALTSGDVLNATAWDCIPQRRAWNKPQPMIPGTTVIDMSAIGRTKIAKTRMVNRYFVESGYRNAGSGRGQSPSKPQRGSSHWTIPHIVHRRAKELRQHIDLLKAQQATTPRKEASGTAILDGNRRQNSQVAENKAIKNSQGHTFTIVGEGWGWKNEIRRRDISPGLDGVLPKVDISCMISPVWDWNPETFSRALGNKADDTREEPRFKSVLPPTLLSLRDTLCAGGHVHQPGEVVLQHLDCICGKSDRATPEVLLREAIDSGLVVDVSRWVGSDKADYAWRRTVEGEAAFARNVVWNSVNGGAGEIVYGDPGTGKTHEVACRVARESTACLVGSTQGNSALTLQRPRPIHEDDLKLGWRA